jgi:sigma-B regulation protein RsbU (phosphoserine phosphatase)
MFVTAIVLALDCRKHSVTMVNAGHPYALLKHADGDVDEVEMETGFPIGVLEGVDFPEEEFSLAPEERLCLFTDGITEAMNEDKEPFGEERLQNTVLKAGNTAANIVETLQREIDSYTGKASQSDDLTVICFGPEG